MPTYVQTVALAYGKELRAVMRTYYLSPWIGLETGLLYVFAA